MDSKRTGIIRKIFDRSLPTGFSSSVALNASAGKKYLSIYDENTAYETKTGSVEYCTQRTSNSLMYHMDGENLRVHV
jgi:hypothetical protein